MSSNNDVRGANTSCALSLLEKRTLSETRSFTKKCENKIAEDKRNFADKSRFGLWWDAKGLFNCSDVEEVTAHMERYKKIYEEIDTYSAQVEKGDPNSYERLVEIYEDLEEMERDALRDVENNQSSAICQMLREFLDKKYNLDHNLKKVECIVMKQQMSDFKQAFKNSEDRGVQMSKKIEKLDKLIEENRGIREVIEIMRKEKEELASEAEKRSEAIRRESDEKLKRVLKEAEERSEARIRKMKEESDKLRLEAEMIRRESDEKLKKAVEEANRRSEARMQEMAEHNRANLQKMTEMLKAMNVP